MWVTVLWLGQCVGHWQWSQDLSLAHKLAFWRTFYLKEYLTQLWFRVRDLVLPQLDVPDFVHSPWEALPSLSEEWMGSSVGEWWRRKVRGQLRLVCKMKCCLRNLYSDYYRTGVVCNTTSSFKDFVFFPSFMPEIVVLIFFNIISYWKQILSHTIYSDYTFPSSSLSSSLHPLLLLPPVSLNLFYHTEQLFSQLSLENKKQASKKQQWNITGKQLFLCPLWIITMPCEFTFIG